MREIAAETVERHLGSHATDGNREDWVSGHLYYHQNLDRVVRGFVHPLVVALAKDGWITGFFFIRHGLGGPHVRLRLRPVAGASERALDEMQRLARIFLVREPSTRSLDGDAIRHINAMILKTDPHEVDGTVYPDNSYHVVPFRPEIERYGGPSRFRLSLDYFTLSSVAAVDFHFGFGNAGRSLQLAQAYELMLRQALGFAIEGNELADLLRYGVDWLGQDLPKVIEKADDVARAQMELFVRLFFESLGEVRFARTQTDTFDLSPRGLLVTGASRLSAAIGTAERESRVRIGASQLHMTASRLGLSNAEEVYLSRLLTLTLSEAFNISGTDLFWVRETVIERTTQDPATAIRELLPHALTALAGLPGAGPARA